MAAPEYNPPPPGATLDTANPLYPRIIAMFIVDGDGGFKELRGGGAVTGTPKYSDRGMFSWAVDFDGTYGLTIAFPTWASVPDPFGNWAFMVGADVVSMSSYDSGVWGIWPDAPNGMMPMAMSRYANYDNVFSVWIPAPLNRNNMTGSEDITVELIGQGYHVFGLNRGGAVANDYTQIEYIFDDSVRTPRGNGSSAYWGTGGEVDLALNENRLPVPNYQMYFFWGLILDGHVDKALQDSLAYDPWQLLVAGDPPVEFDGGLAGTESVDTAAFSGAKTYFGSIGATEPVDTTAFSGTMIPSLLTGTMPSLERLDDAAFFGDSSPPGDSREGGLEATEPRDTAAFSGAKTYFGSIAAFESVDAAAFMGTMIPKFVTGTMSAQETLDAAAFSDGTQRDEMGNTIAIRDANCGIGISPEAKWKDGAPSWGRGGSDPELEFPMSLGHGPNDQNWSNNVTTRQMRLVQAISDTPPQADVIPGWASYVGAKAGEWVWCINRTDNVSDNDNPLGRGDAVAV
jgi:hypothetical protein